MGKASVHTASVCAFKKGEGEESKSVGVAESSLRCTLRATRATEQQLVPLKYCFYSSKSLSHKPGISPAAYY